MTTRKITIARWLPHVAFWILSVFFIGSFFSVSNTVERIDFFYSLLFHLPLVILVYLNLLVLIPRLLEKDQYGLYGVSGLVLLGITYLVHEATFEVLLPILPTGFYIVSFADAGLLLIIFAAYLALTTLLHLARSWYRLQQMVKEQLSTELGSLRAQLNPHFLFNSLNSIYSMALAQSEQTAQTVLRLSDLLRYTLYELKEEHVPLTKEIEMMRSYLELQGLRTDASTEVKFEVDGDIDQQTIAPLLLFPLVENAYKHGVKGVSEDGYIHIYLEARDGIDFTISNSKGTVDEVEAFKSGGIGLQNVRRRLELLYPDRHELVIDDSDTAFTVKLSLR